MHTSRSTPVRSLMLAGLCGLLHLAAAATCSGAERRVPSGWVGGADLLVGISVPMENPVGGDSGFSPALQGQLRLGHELGVAARLGRLELVLAGFATHPSGVSSWGLDSTYAVQGYGGLRYTTPLLKVVSFNAGVGYGGLIAIGTPQTDPPSKLLPHMADDHGPVVTAGLDIGFRKIGLVVEADHFFALGQLTYIMAGVRFGR